MIRPRRRWKVRLHLSSGATTSFTCGGIRITKDGNTLTGIELTRGAVPFYTRLEAIEMITVRRSWLHWEIV